jgi:hypothetical protein
MKTIRPALTFGFSLLLAGAALAQGGEEAEVLADGRALSFPRHAKPYFKGRTAMVPMRDMAGKLGVRIEGNDQADGFRFTFRGDEAYYRKWRRDFDLNGRTRSLPAEGEETNRTIFIPLELFRDLTDRDLAFRRIGDSISVPSTPRPREEIDIRFRGQRLGFERSEEPRYVRSMLYLPVGAMVRRTGIRFEEEDRGRRMRFTYEDRTIEFTKGREDFVMNGGRFWMNAPSLEISGVLFVPHILFQRLLGRDYSVGGATWEGRPNWDDRPQTYPGRPDWDDRPRNGVGRPVTLRYKGKDLRFGGNEQPFIRGTEVYVPVKALANRLKVKFEGRDRDRLIRLTRDGEEVRYEAPLPFYELNGRRENLRNGSMEFRNILFVPIDVFNVFSGGQVEVRGR